jgi:hypothetical protein
MPLEMSKDIKYNRQGNEGETLMYILIVFFKMNHHVNRRAQNARLGLPAQQAVAAGGALIPGI